VIEFDEGEDGNIQDSGPKSGKKYKSEEAAAGMGKDGKSKKYKAEETALMGAGQGEEDGAKQRKANKKLKDYEVAAGVGGEGGASKKDA
jgi:hypothetical protein